MGDLKKLMIGVVIFSIVIVGIGAQLLGDVVTTYNITAEDNFSSSKLNKIAETSAISTSMSGQIQNATVNENALYLAGSGAYSALKMAFSMFGIVTDMVTEGASYIGIPGWMLGAIITIVITAILIIILSAVFRYDL